jgi:hypothetical protein
MAVNPLGFVQVSDFGNPWVIQGIARETISGGQFVGVSGATGVVGSQLASYTIGDVEFVVLNDPENAVGVALETVTSGNALGVANNGQFLVRCAGSVFAGRLVKAESGLDAVTNLGSQVVPANAEDASIAGNIFGRAHTAGASGGFALVHIKP